MPPAAPTAAGPGRLESWANIAKSATSSLAPVTVAVAAPKKGAAAPAATPAKQQPPTPPSPAVAAAAAPVVVPAAGSWAALVRDKAGGGSAVPTSGGSTPTAAAAAGAGAAAAAGAGAAAKGAPPPATRGASPPAPASKPAKAVAGEWETVKRGAKPAAVVSSPPPPPPAMAAAAAAAKKVVADEGEEEARHASPPPPPPSRPAPAPKTSPGGTGYDPLGLKDDDALLDAAIAAAAAAAAAAGGPRGGTGSVAPATPSYARAPPRARPVPPPPVPGIQLADAEEEEEPGAETAGEKDAEAALSAASRLWNEKGNAAGAERALAAASAAATLLPAAQCGSPPTDSTAVRPFWKATLHSAHADLLGSFGSARLPDAVAALEAAWGAAQAAGATHPGLAVKEGSRYAVALRQAGRPAEARAVYEVVLPAAEAAHGPDSAPAISSRHGLAECLQEGGDLRGAAALLGSAADAFQDALSSVDTAAAGADPDASGAALRCGAAAVMTLVELGRLQDAGGDGGGGAATLRDAARLAALVHGEGAPQTGFALGHLAACLKRDGAPAALAEAAGVYERLAAAALARAAAASRAGGGPGGPAAARSAQDAALALRTLADVRSGLGELDEAASLCEEAARVMARALGPSHPVVEGFWSAAASACAGAGDAEGAAAAAKEAQKLRAGLLRTYAGAARGVRPAGRARR